MTEIETEKKAKNTARCGRWKAKNREVYNALQNSAHEDNRGYWLNWLKPEHKRCWRCGYSDCFEAIDFHHLDPKTKTKTIGQLIATLRFNEKNVLKMSEELSKCIPLCANCHRYIHAEMRRYQDA